MNLPGDEPGVQLQIDIAPEMEGGAYADLAAVWHTMSTFVIDFVAVKQPPIQMQDDGGNAQLVQPCRVTARVRIPPQQVFEIAKALTSQLTAWEQETGQRPPESGIPGVAE